MRELSFSEIWYWFLVMAVVSYFIGCFNFALVISRFKGLGEMEADQLAETTLSPETRRLLPVGIGSFSNEDTRRVMTLLMGSKSAAGRRVWMETWGDRAELDV